MPRKVTASLVRDIPADRMYNSVQVQRLINRVMRDGKKQVAERLVYTGMETAAKKLKVDNPLDVFEQAFGNIRPHLETRSRRVGGANYQIPFEVRPARRMALSMRWLREAARKRSEKSMAQRLAGELLEAAEGRGAAMKKREEVHRMAEANKAFSHYRF